MTTQSPEQKLAEAIRKALDTYSEESNYSFAEIEVNWVPMYQVNSPNAQHKVVSVTVSTNNLYIA